jgi:hypothetical protein
MKKIGCINSRKMHNLFYEITLRSKCKIYFVITYTNFAVNPVNFD